MLIETFLLENPNRKTSTAAYKESVKQIQEKEDSLSFNVIANSPKWLLVQDTYYPGWKAYINGKETSIYLADSMFKAIIVPEGRSQVELKFEPSSFYIGRAISIATFIILILFIGYIPLLRWFVP